MTLPLRPALIAAAVLAASGTAHAQTYYVQQSYDTVVTDPVAVTPVERTTVYRNIFPQGPGRAPIVRERIVTERFAPDVVRERVVVQPQETVVVEPRGYNYVAAPYGYNNYNYGYGYEVARPVVAETVVTPVVTERVVRRPAVTVYGTRNGYAVRDAYARVEGPAREIVYEVDAAPRLTCKQRFRSWDPRTQTYLGFDGLRHPCVD